MDITVLKFQKLERKNYIRTKFLVSFLAPFIIMTLALGINLLLSYILFAGGTYSLGLFEMHFANDLLHNFSLNNPF